MENKLKIISENTGLSISTVKRALASKSGVSAETGRRVILEAERVGYRFKYPEVEIAAVIPSTPSSFWGELEEALFESLSKSGHTFKILLYSDINNEDGALSCVDFAEKSSARVLISATCNGERIKSRLERFAKDKFLILIDEDINIEGACYVGENSYEEGARLARHYFSVYGDRKNIAVVSCKSSDIGRRMEGFLDAMREYPDKKAIPIKIDMPESTKARTAVVARELKKYEEEIDCVLYSSGNVEFICEAMYKLRPKREIHVIGYEINRKAVRKIGFKDLKLVFNQNLSLQSRLAADLASAVLDGEEIPKNRTVYVPSEILLGE